MARHQTAPSTPPHQRAMDNVSDMMGELVIPPTPRKPRLTEIFIAPTKRSKLSKGHQVQAGKITKRRSILKLAGNSSSKNIKPDQRVRFDDTSPNTAPNFNKETPRTPPRPSTPHPKSSSQFSDAPATPTTMAAPTSPPAAPHKRPRRKCSDRTRIKQQATAKPLGVILADGTTRFDYRGRAGR